MPKMQLTAKQAEIMKRRVAGEKLQGQTYAEIFEVKDPWPYYDTAVLDHTKTAVILFQNGSTPVRSLTNYPYKELPSGQAFDIHSLRVSYVGLTAQTDVNQLAMIAYLNKTVIQVQIENKIPIFERNLGAMIGGQIQVVTAPAVTVGSQNLSKWVGNTVIRFKKKIKLDAKTIWKVNLLSDAANAAGIDNDYLRVETIGVLTAQL